MVDALSIRVASDWYSIILCMIARNREIKATGHVRGEQKMSTLPSADRARNKTNRKNITRDRHSEYIDILKQFPMKRNVRPSRFCQFRLIANENRIRCLILG